MGRVGLIGENSVEYIDRLLDIWNSGDCAVLIDWRIPYRTTVEMMAEAAAQKCYIESVMLEKVPQKMRVGMEFVPYEKSGNSAQALPDGIYDKFKANYSADEAVVIYSSGTTGKAKGIILSHYAINTNTDAIIDYMRPVEDDCIYMAKKDALALINADRRTVSGAEDACEVHGRANDCPAKIFVGQHRQISGDDSVLESDATLHIHKGMP